MSEEQPNMKRTCILCDSEYELTPKEVQYLVRVRMIHPYFTCKKCSVGEVNGLTRERQDKLIATLGNPDNREKLWKELFEDYPQVRAAYVMHELDIKDSEDP